jgi:GrpB-like predicted nucleotidyltransferase (UPF0157 family)
MPMTQASETSLEKIILAEYDPGSPEQFENQRQVILGAIGAEILAIEHIGSSSVPGLGGKPIIDIIAGLATLDRAELCIDPLRQIGYVEREIPAADRRFFQKHKDGVRTYHLHLVEQGTEAWRRPIAFRDFLRSNSQEAAEYYAVKQKIAIRYSLDREGYTAAKSSYVLAILERCRAAGMNV